MLQATLSRFMPSSSEEEIIGTAEVKQFFPGPRDFDGIHFFLPALFRSLTFCICCCVLLFTGVVVGAIVTSGELRRECKFRIIRNEKVIFSCDGLDSLRRFSDEVNKVAKGVEFGCSIPYAGTKEGDKLVFYSMKDVQKPLSIQL